MNKPLFIMIKRFCGESTVGDNVIRRAEAVAYHYQPLIISDTFPEQLPRGIRTVLIKPPRFDFLHRFCHVPNEISFALTARKTLLEICEKEKVALILCHGYAVPRFTGLWIKKRKEIPFGMYTQDQIFNLPKGLYDWRLTVFYKSILPICCRKTDVLFCLNEGLAEDAIKRGMNPRRVVAIPNGFSIEDIGIDIKERDQKLERRALSRPLRLLYVGRLSEEKGVDVLLEACSKLMEKGCDFQLDIVGSGPQEETLKKMSGTLGLPDEKIKFIGAIPRSKLGPYYLNHDILVVPSKSEALGNVILEGMAAGCLVVASNTGGIPSVVKDRLNGLLFNVGRSEELAAILYNLEENVFKFLVRNSVEDVQKKFNWKHIGIKIVEKLKEIEILHKKPQL